MPLMHLALGVAFSLIMMGCSSTRLITQRAYIEPETLMGTNVKETSEKEGSIYRSTKMAHGTMLEINPILEKDLLKLAQEFGYKENLSEKEILTNFETLKEANEMDRRTCFQVLANGTNEDEANLRYYQVFLDQNPKPLKLELLANERMGRRNSQPERTEKIGSYSEGGSVYSIGETTYVTPATTHVYSYFTYSDSATLCANRKLDLSKGVTIFVEPRQTKGLPISDLVWSTNPEDKKTYSSAEGIPSFKNEINNFEDAGTAVSKQAQWRIARQEYVRQRLAK